MKLHVTVRSVLHGQFAGLIYSHNNPRDAIAMTLPTRDRNSAVRAAMTLRSQLG